MNKEEIINELNKQNIELGEELSLVKDRLNKILFEKEKVEQENQQLKKQKDDVVELIKKQDKIRNYYEYEECGYDEYNYDDDFKEELLRMLGEIDDN